MASDSPGSAPAHASFDVVLQDAQGDPVQSGTHGGDLDQDVDAVLLVVDHPVDAPDLAFYPAEALAELVLAVPVGARPLGRGPGAGMPRLYP